MADFFLNRRDWLRTIGASGVAAGLAAGSQGAAVPQSVGESSGFQSHVVDPHKMQDTSSCPRIVGGRVVQPERQLDVLTTTDVLVIGGGSAGVAAAIAARRAGAEVTLVERYGHFGGLWTGGLVLVVIGHIVKGGKQVCQGVGEEMLRRLDKLEGAVINRRPGSDPTVDAEAVKYVMVEMIEEAGVNVFLHCWGVDAILDGNRVAGAVFESKSGRQAILAKCVVDATGDGDVFAAAGAEFEHRTHNIGLVSRIGNMDHVGSAAAGAKPTHLGHPTPAPGINWVNMRGPEVDGLDLATLTKMEMSHRKFIWQSIQKTRRAAGYDKVFLVETAPQLGVRITRVLNGMATVTRDDIDSPRPRADVVGVGGATGQKHGEWRIPYGALVPRTVDNVLAAGRCISADSRMADLVRLIPNCLVTGHAAGAAAAVCAMDECRPRDADVAKIQRVLREQEAYLG